MIVLLNFTTYTNFSDKHNECSHEENDIFYVSGAGINLSWCDGALLQNHLDGSSRTPIV